MRVEYFFIVSVALLVKYVDSYQMKNEQFHPHRKLHDLNHGIQRSTSSPTDRHPNLSTLLHFRSSVAKKRRHQTRDTIKNVNRWHKNRVPRRRRSNVEASSSTIHQFESEHRISVRLEASKKKAFTYYHMNGLHLR
jgi:hypothetical protein